MIYGRLETSSWTSRSLNNIVVVLPGFQRIDSPIDEN